METCHSSKETDDLLKGQAVASSLVIWASVVTQKLHTPTLLVRLFQNEDSLVAHAKANNVNVF